MDTFTKGLVAGLGAGLFQSLFNLVSHALNATEMRYLDFAAIMIYGRLPLMISEVIFAQLAQFLFAGLLGVIFAYLMSAITTNKLHFLKGWFYSVVVWFSIYTITVLFSVPELAITTFSTSASNFVGASIFGLFLAYFWKRLSRATI